MTRPHPAWEDPLFPELPANLPWPVIFDPRRPSVRNPDEGHVPIMLI